MKNHTYIVSIHGTYLDLIKPFLVRCNGTCIKGRRSPRAIGLMLRLLLHSCDLHCMCILQLYWRKGGQRNISKDKFFSTMDKKIFLWIYTFQAILKPFHTYNFVFQNFEIFILSLITNF